MKANFALLTASVQQWSAFIDSTVQTVANRIEYNKALFVTGFVYAIHAHI